MARDWCSQWRRGGPVCLIGRYQRLSPFCPLSTVPSPSLLASFKSPGDRDSLTVTLRLQRFIYIQHEKPLVVTRPHAIEFLTVVPFPRHTVVLPAFLRSPGSAIMITFVSTGHNIEVTSTESQQEPCYLELCAPLCYLLLECLSLAAPYPHVSTSVGVKDTASRHGIDSHTLMSVFASHQETLKHIVGTDLSALLV
eukprot:742119-Rhodomonas_salina.1